MDRLIFGSVESIGHGLHGFFWEVGLAYLSQYSYSGFSYFFYG